MLMPAQTLPTARAAALPQPWCLPPSGLAVFHGERHAPRLSHYFLPRLALEGKRILFLDGANCVDPRLMARLAERRGIPFAQFNQQIMLARAFTCFQLTELISRVPQFLAQFPAQVVIVTAFPELYFDEDIRQADAQAAFQQALGHLRRCALTNGGERAKLENRNSKIVSELPSPEFGGAKNENRNSEFGIRNSASRPRASIFEFRVSSFDLSVALFSAASSFQPPAGRQRFFAQTCAAAAELWKFQTDDRGRMGLTQQDKVLGTGGWGLGMETRNSVSASRLGTGGWALDESLKFRTRYLAYEFRFSSFGFSPAPGT
jgi:hypothetical protein